MSSTQNNALGFLRTCMDKRFVAATRAAFERATGLSATDYWHESYAGGSAVAPASTVGEVYAVAHGATIFGWQAHINTCGGQPGVSDEEIGKRLDRVVAAMVEQYPHARHFRILASERGIDIKEVASERK
jgi:hypothetical protein